MSDNLIFKLLCGAALTAAAAPLADAYTIYPVPQSIEEKTSEINYPDRVTIVAPDDLSSIIVNRAREVLEAAGISVATASKPTDGVDLIIGVNGSNDAADVRGRQLKLNRGIFENAATDPHYDSHIIALDNQGDFVVIGDATGSAFYAMATLEQILEQSAGQQTVKAFTVYDYSHTQFRGVVEGFYGHPFTVESRLDIFDFFKRYKLNYYLYAPKADPYHTGSWREPYPESITDDERNLGQIASGELADLARKARECNIDLVWACHPALQGNAISFTNLEPGVEAIMKKFAAMYELGFRHFGVSVDDISGHPSTQWQLGDMVQKAIDQTYNGTEAAEADRVGHLIFVPSQYALNYDRSYSSLKPFANADPSLEVAFTGHDCFSNVRQESFTTMAGIIDRDPVFWWNNPVNDDYDEFLYMHGLGVRWVFTDKGRINHMKGFLLNPMNQGQASKICFFNGADYAWNPEAYDEAASWEAAVDHLGHTPEMAQALRSFIKCLSAYTTHDTRTPEGEIYADLYNACRNDINNGDTDDGWPELLARMTETREACRTLREMQTSDRAGQRLLFADIEPWLNKVEEQADIIVRSIELINGCGDLENWTDFLTLVKRANAISTDRRYFHSALEGSGTNSYEVWREVEPTPKYMDDFAAFIAAEAVKHSPELPARDLTPATVNNLRETVAIPLPVAADTTLTLAGIADIELDYGEYIGIDTKQLAALRIAPLTGVAAEIEIETSVNGKEWTPAVADGQTAFEAAYVRVINRLNRAVAIGADNLTVIVPKPKVAETNPTATTNMGTYMDYTIDNVVDGDHSTFFWKNTNQSDGDWVTLDFGEVSQRYDVTLVFNDNDKPTGTATIQYSENGTDFTDAASFTMADIIDNTYSCNLGGVAARYVRLYMSVESSAYWFQLAEFTVNSTAPDTLSAATDNNSTAIFTLDDRKLSTGYTPVGEGWLIFRFIDNLAITSVDIYHNSTFSDAAPLPVISVSGAASDELIEKGQLEKACETIDVTDVENVTEMRIEWNGVNRPSLYEILAHGEPFVETAPDKPSAIETMSAAARISILADGNQLTIIAPEPILAIEIYGLDGRLLQRTTPGNERATLPRPEGHTVVKVTLPSGSHTIKN